MQNLGDTQVGCNPLNTRRVPITIEHQENTDLCAKESILRFTPNTEPDEKISQESKSPAKTQPNLARNSTTFPTKPPQGKQNVQIQRDASKEEIDKKSTIQRNHHKKDNFDQQNNSKNEVDFEQIQTQLEVLILILAVSNQLWFLTTISL